MKKLTGLDADEVCTYIKDQIQRKYGDEIGTHTWVTARNGYFYIEFGSFKVILRRSKLATFLRSL